MEPEVSIDEICAKLRDLAAKGNKLDVFCGDFDRYSGNVAFRTDDGWHFVVFADAGQFDYFASVSTPDGRVILMPDVPDDVIDRETEKRVFGFHKYDGGFSIGKRKKPW